MKAVARVGMNGDYVGDQIVDDSFTGIAMAFDWETLTDGAGNPAGKQIGYDVGYPVPGGLYKPKYDMETYQKGPEFYADPSLLWVEGLSEAEIKELTKPNNEKSLKDIVDAQAQELEQLWDFVLSGGAR